MKRLAVAVAAVCASGWIHAGEPVDARLDADPDGTVVIDVVRGSVKVMGWDQNVVHVQGTRDDKSREFVFERDGRVIQIADEVKSHSGRDNDGTRITVQVPRNSTVELETVSASQDVRKIGGAARLESVSGDINAADIGRGAELGSVSGDVVLSGANGEVRLESVSGDIKASINADRLGVESVSGDVDVDNTGILRRLDASTVSGDLLLETALGPDAEADLESVSGNVELVLRGELNARISLETGPGGDIENQLTDQKPDRERYTGAESLELKVGQGGADVDASVVSGTITLGHE